MATSLPFALLLLCRLNGSAVRNSHSLDAPENSLIMKANRTYRGHASVRLRQGLFDIHCRSQQVSHYTETL